MSLLVVNASSGHDDEVQKAISVLSRNAKDSHIIDASSMRIQPCRGCYMCMLVTPGKCCIQDEIPEIIREMLHHDYTVFICDTALNFVDHKAKNIIDRLFPVVSITLQFSKEIIHIPRYQKTPRIAVFYTGTADHALLNTWMERIEVNLSAQSLGAFPVAQANEVAQWIS